MFSRISLTDDIAFPGFSANEIYEGKRKGHGILQCNHKLDVRSGVGGDEGPGGMRGFYITYTYAYIFMGAKIVPVRLKRQDLERPDRLIELGIYRSGGEALRELNKARRRKLGACSRGF